MTAALASVAAVGALASFVLAAIVAHRRPPRPTVASRRPSHATVPAPLVERDRLLTDATHHRGPVERRLRPLFRAIATGRLRARGIDLDSDPERARPVLSEELFALVDPANPEQADRLGPGLRREEIEALIAELEEL